MVVSGFIPSRHRARPSGSTCQGSRRQGADGGFIRLAEVIALTYHEKWDGSGYPIGIGGREIPMVGRITALADVFDAMTSRRPYKEAFSVARSFEIIREERGKHFDLDVVGAFFAIEDEILSVKEAHKDEKESLFVQMAMGTLGR